MTLMQFGTSSFDHEAAVHVDCSYKIFQFCSIFLQERLAHLKRQCQPHVTEAAKSSVEGICSKMYNMAFEAVKKIHEKHSEVLRESGIQGFTE